MEIFSEYFDETPKTFLDLKDKLQEKKLVVKENKTLGLFLVKYDKTQCDMTDPLVQKCRGLVGKTDDLSLICLPPVKSQKLESFVENVQWDTIEQEEFVDGTMINMFYLNDKWLISTRSNIGANCRWIGSKNFSTLFEESHNKLDYDLLDKQYFYTFVLTHPDNRIVKEYTEPDIILVQVGRIVNSKVELLDLEDQNIGVRTPVRYSEGSLNDAISFVNNQDYNFQGLVLKNGNNRTKIRNLKYNYARSLKSNTNNLCYLYFYLKQNMFVDDYIRFFPEHTNLFKQYEQKFDDLVKRIHENYINYHVNKSLKNINDMPFRLRPICYELHGNFKKTKKPISMDIVYNYMLSLEIPRILFTLKQD